MCVPSGSKFSMLQQMIVFYSTVRTRIFRVIGMPTYICRVTNNFVLEFLPTLHAPFDQDLRTETETLRREITQFVRVVCETRAETTQREGRPQDDGVSNLFSSSEGVVDRRDSRRLSGGNINLCNMQSVTATVP